MVGVLVCQTHDNPHARALCAHLQTGWAVLGVYRYGGRRGAACDGLTERQCDHSAVGLRREGVRHSALLSLQHRPHYRITLFNTVLVKACECCAEKVKSVA
ncbi:hypothetical protein E2C01_059578 [Portunus trituberculatus]|uniref:Uncharacterized protein n=1 Tax=Portunus trituberculatus TaxID=210409 RepID=A0A5B7H9F4_PORTR|nr:hypothetical protein [Portunus trituberculatus]